MRQALKISNDEMDEMVGTLKGLAALFTPDGKTVARLKRFLAAPTSRQTRTLLDAIESLPGYDWREIAALRVELARLEKTDVAPAPLVTGDDLTSAGFSPGPTFKRVLDGVYDAQLEDRVRTKAEAMELAARMFGERENRER
jgi:poly(A) polymerase